MNRTKQQLLDASILVKNETLPEANTAKRIGGILYDISEHLTDGNEVVDLQAIYPNTGELIARFKFNGDSEYISLYAPRRNNGNNGIQSINIIQLVLLPNLFSIATIQTDGESAGDIKMPSNTITSLTPKLNSGIPIATFKLLGNNLEQTLYINDPSNAKRGISEDLSAVKVYNQYDENTGIKIADIEIDGKLFPIYIPIQQGTNAATPTSYSYIIEYQEERVFTKYLVIQGHSGLNGQDISREKVISSTGYKPEEEMGKALQLYGIGLTIVFRETFLERTTDNNFTTNGTPKFIRCGQVIQNQGWKLINTGPSDIIPGHGYGSFEEFQRYDYPIAGRLGWNSGLDVNQDNSEFGVNTEGLPNNPPTKFEVYANIDYNNNGGIYKFGEYSSNMDGITYNVAENSEGLWLIKAIRGTFTPIITTNSTTDTPTYTNEINVLAANDNILMAGYTVLRNGRTITVDGVDEIISESTWNRFKTNPEKYIFANGRSGAIEHHKWYRTYLSDPEFYPSNDSYSRGYKKAFSRWPQSGFFDRINGTTEVTYSNSSMTHLNITLRRNDIFIYFKKKENVVSTNVYLSALVGINGSYIPASSYGIPGEKWQLASLGAVLMYALENDDWISYYDTAFDIPGVDPVGGKWIWENGKPKKDGNGNYIPNPHYHPTEYSFECEEYVIKPDGTRYERFGGDGYLIFAFRVNKDILNFNQLVI